jgi:hypothetical protein
MNQAELELDAHPQFITLNPIHKRVSSPLPSLSLSLVTGTEHYGFVRKGLELVPQNF